MNYDKYIKQGIYIRELETYLLEMFSKGLLNGTVHTCVGQELIPVIISKYLEKNDKIFSNHRGHGHYIANDNSIEKLILELIGKSEGVSSGIGGSQHIYTDTFISNGIQGGLAPVSVGYSFAQSQKKRKDISVCYVGDGTLGEGQFYEALTLASIFKTPTLFVIENNGYAQSTCNKYTLKGDVGKRIEGFGIKFLNSNIWDLSDLDSKSKESVDQVRNGIPTVLEVKCFRLNSHSKGDDNRKETEIEEFKNKDLINIYIKENFDWYQKYSKELKEKFDNVVEKSNKSNNNNFDLNIIKNNSVLKVDIKWEDYQFNYKQDNQRLNKSINAALKLILKKYKAILIGEDIIDSTPEAPIQYGGAFKVTKGLSKNFPSLVKNTSISEAGIIGFGIGCSLNGKPSIVEIMFGDFMTLCVDQLIQQASKIPTMYGKEIDIPLIIRTPMGGRRGYGPTHSQNIEKLFLFWPNIDVLAINCLTDTNLIYENAINNRKTTIIIEDKVSYTQKTLDKPPSGYTVNTSNEIFPTYNLSPEFADHNAIIIAYGAMLNEVIDVLPALFEEEIFPQVISPTRLSPLNINIFKGISFKDKPCIFIEEGSRRAAWSSEVISSLMELGEEFANIIRISNEHIIPCSKEIEDLIIPSKLNLFEKIKEKL